MMPDSPEPKVAKPEDNVLEPEEVVFDAAETAFMQNTPDPASKEDDE